MKHNSNIEITFSIGNRKVTRKMRTRFSFVLQDLEAIFGSEYKDVLVNDVLEALGGSLDFETNKLFIKEVYKELDKDISLKSRHPGKYNSSKADFPMINVTIKVRGNSVTRQVVSLCPYAPNQRLHEILDAQQVKKILDWNSDHIAKQLNKDLFYNVLREIVKKHENHQRT